MISQLSLLMESSCMVALVEVNSSWREGLEYLIKLSQIFIAGTAVRVQNRCMRHYVVATAEWRLHLL